MFRPFSKIKAIRAIRPIHAIRRVRPWHLFHIWRNPIDGPIQPEATSQPHAPRPDDQALQKRIEIELDRVIAGRKAVPYRQLAAKVGLQPDDPRFHHTLAAIGRSDLSQHRPPRPAVLFNRKLGMPGDRFFALLQEVRGAYDPTPEGKRRIWLAELGRLGVSAV